MGTFLWCLLEKLVHSVHDFVTYQLETIEAGDVLTIYIIMYMFVFTDVKTAMKTPSKSEHQNNTIMYSNCVILDDFALLWLSVSF